MYHQLSFQLHPFPSVAKLLLTHDIFFSSLLIFIYLCFKPQKQPTKGMSHKNNQ